MKKIISFCFLFAFAATAFAQKETFDIVTYTPPNEWEKKVTENILTYSIINKTNNSWCQVGIIRSTNSKGSIEQDFESEWEEFIVKNYKPTGTPQLGEVQEADGWKIKSGATTFSFNNSDGIALLRTISGFDRCVSIVTTTNSEDYLKAVETFMSSIELKKPEVQSTQKKTSNNNVSVAGTWGFGNNAMMANNRYGPWNYSKQQYTFNANGTYNFIRKTYRENDAETLLTRETGTYAVSGTTLTIIPKKNVIEAWSKKNGGDNYNKLVKSQSQAIEKTSYSFYIYFDETLKQTSLMLQASTDTKRDGKYNAAVENNNMWRYLQAPGYIEIKLPDELNVQPTINNANSPVIGTWGISSTVASYYNMGINEGTIITQYTFNANGTYSFYIKTFRYQLDKLLLTRETGIYQISGNNITISPQKSVIESWSKKNGTDAWGELLTSQKKDLEKTTYQFSIKDFGSGPLLVLEAGQVTKRDGPFNNSDKDAWFYPSKSGLELIKLPAESNN